MSAASESRESSLPIDITSPEQFAQVLRSARVVISVFRAGDSSFAEIDPNLRTVYRIFDELSQALTRANQFVFARINTASQPQIVQIYGITVSPTFITFKSGRETKRVKGADINSLQEYVRELAREASTVGSGEGSSTSRTSGKGWSGVALPKGYEDVTEQVDQQGLDFLNLDGEAGIAKKVFSLDKPSAFNGKLKESAEKDWIESDTDEQLMLFVPFQSTMKLHSIHITSIIPANSDDGELLIRPRTIRLYTNRTTVLGFDEADDTVSTQSIEIKESDWDSKTSTAKVELRFVKFQNISSLVIFVADGLGDGEKTRIDRIRLIGEAGEKKAMGKLEKIGNEQGE